MSDQEHEQHHIVPLETLTKVFAALLVLTVVTVVVSRIDLGMLNFTVAMLIASVKAAAVMMFFMGLKWDTNENRSIFLSSLVFLFIFVALTFSDIMFRPEMISKSLKIDSNAPEAVQEQQQTAPAESKTPDHG